MVSDPARILIIDDDPFIKMLAEFILRKRGYQVRIAAHGRQGQEEIATGPRYDLIVLDLMMPEMDGMAFLRWLRGEAHLTTPVLVQTGMGPMDMEQRVLAAGADDLIHKPYDDTALVAKVEALLARNHP